MLTFVKGWGRLDATIVLIGEAPAGEEVLKGEPFVGAAGRRLNEWLKGVGLSRADCYIDNVVQCRVPNDKMSLVSQASLMPWIEDLHQRLARLTCAQVIVPLGNYPLYALTGKGQVHWHSRDGKSARPGITAWRGSILSYTATSGRTVKVIPTIHPSATFRQPSLERQCLSDWERIRDERGFPELRLPVREHFITPTLKDLEVFYQDVTSLYHPVLAVDIENPREERRAPLLDGHGQPQRYKTGKRKGHVKHKTVWGDPAIVCVGFSHDPAYSLTIPTTESYWGDRQRLEQAWAWIQKLCECPAEKALHNGLYDLWYLSDRGIGLVNWPYDTMLMHHCLDPSAPHSLAFCASVDTREPYWKADAKDPDAVSKWTSNWTAFLQYNGKDAAVTRELAALYRQRLEADRRTNGQTGWEIYQRLYTPLFAPLHDLSRWGMRLDDRRRKARLLELQASMTRIQASLTQATGVDLYGKTGLSAKRLTQYFYETLTLPVQYAKRTTGIKTESANEVAVRRLMTKYPEKFPQAVGQSILDHRRAAQLSTFYRDERVDPDRRFRSSYSMNTEAARLSSSANPRGTGSSGQNIDREARDMFLADEGCLGVEVDLSQAEARIDYLLASMVSGNKVLLEKARLRPDEYDQHSENTTLIFNLREHEVSKEEWAKLRYLGKKTVHGSWRDLHGQKMADELSKDGYVRTGDECQALLDIYGALVPERAVFFRWVRERIIRDRYLENTWGYRLSFKYDRLNDDTYRRGYSFDPQSEIALLMNHLGLVPLWERLAGGGWREGRINLQGHDALFLSLQPGSAYDVVHFLVTNLEQPRSYYGLELSIPCTIKIGMRWKGEHEWKRLPPRAEFETVMCRVIATASSSPD